MWFKLTIPKEYRFAAIGVMTKNDIYYYHTSIANEFSHEELSPLFLPKNQEKLQLMLSFPSSKYVLSRWLGEASDAEVIRLMACKDFRIDVPTAEKYFVGQNPDKFFVPYFNAHKSDNLPSEVVRLLIKSNQEELICHLLVLRRATTSL